MGDSFREFRVAVRSLGRDRRLTLAAIVSLSVAIAGSTVVFSVAYNLLFHALAAKDPGQLAVLGISDPAMATGSAAAILARTAVDPDAIAPVMRQLVWTVSPDALVEAVSVRSQLERQSYAVPEFSLGAIGAFAAVGLLLVTGGVFSGMAYTASLMTQELGIRMALGADSRAVMRMLLWRGVKSLGVGALLGIAASIVLTRLMTAQIWGVSMLDPWSYVAATALLAIVGLTACAIPARRASLMDPLVALRCD
jgi:putative ABC transport system permease protein